MGDAGSLGIGELTRGNIDCLFIEKYLQIIDMVVSTGVIGSSPSLVPAFKDRIRNGHLCFILRPESI